MLAGTDAFFSPLILPKLNTPSATSEGDSDGDGEPACEPVVDTSTVSSVTVSSFFFDINGGRLPEPFAGFPVSCFIFSLKKGGMSTLPILFFYYFTA